jgi:aminoglycoside phosphotransferase (APT) family kinase protein
VSGINGADLLERLSAWLPRIVGDDIAVQRVARIPGGASRHTWRVTVDDGSIERDLIFRFDPEVSLLESNRDVEVACYRAMAGVDGVPVPKVLHNEPDAGPLGLPFFVTEALGGEANGGLLAMLSAGERAAITEQFAAVLAGVASRDWESTDLRDLLDPVTPETAWSTELGKWESVLDTHQLSPMPITRAVIRWLRRNPPPPAQRIGLVHGDCRAGNFLFSGSQITAVLDWEMAHVGDPIEDLTWGWLGNWRYDQADQSLVGGLCTKADAVRRWEQATGLTADAHALRWWELLGHVKAVAIWTTGGHQFAAGATPDFLLGLIPWLYTDKQEGWMLELMEEAA